MPSERYNTVIHLLWVAVIIIVCSSGMGAYVTKDGHWVNRGGALVSALAAGAIVFQILMEMGFEQSKHELDHQRHSPLKEEEAASLMPLERLAARMQQTRVKNSLKTIDRQRLAVVLRVVICAMLGEILHGFGDLLVCNSFVECTMH